MVPFSYLRVTTEQDAAHTGARHTSDGSAVAGTDFFAGGTDMLQLMQESVRNPGQIVNIASLPGLDHIDLDSTSLRLGALVRMSDAASDKRVQDNFPVIAEALLASASPQIRNLATLGGNVLQRTRCGYFRDVVTPCNKRVPGSGCPALQGQNRLHAILGTSQNCIATYASDFANALIALDAELRITGAHGNRQIAFSTLHRQPGDTPHIETQLAPGEVITGIMVPITPFARRSHYLKVRDRATFEWSIASAAIALDLNSSGVVRDVRIALGGVATVPWRATKAENYLKGKTLTKHSCKQASGVVAEGAVLHGQNAYKKVLIERTVARALAETGELA